MLPMTNGIMTVDRDFTGMTPCGMKFSTLAGTVGGGIQTPGFVGHSKFYMGSSKFISGDGGLARMVWMPKQLKIADETIAQTEEEVLEHLQKVDHPVLKMDPMF
jgi:acetyl-CoA synthase